MNEEKKISETGKGVSQTAGEDAGQTTGEDVSQTAGEDAGQTTGEDVSQTAGGNAGSHNLVCQTTGNGVAIADGAFEEIDVSEFRKVCNSETLSTVSNAFSNGALRPQDMMPIMLNADNVSGVYARRVAKFDGKSQVVLVFYNKDGMCSEDIPVANCDLYDIVSGEADGATEKMKKDADKSLKKVRNKMLEYWDGTIMFDPQCVVNRVITYQNRLPVDTSQIPDIDEVYAEIVEIAEKQISHPVNADIYRKGFYAFPSDLFESIAEKFQMSSTDLAKYLKRNSLLYLQGSSLGYQCYVKYFDENCYCVRTLKQFQRKVTPYKSPEEVWKML